MWDLAVLWELGKFSIDSYRWAEKNLSRKVDHLIPRIEHFVNREMSKVRVHRIVQKAPRVSLQGSEPLAPAVVERAAEIRPSLALNELHALAVRWSGEEVANLRVVSADFAEVLALREHARSTPALLPNVLSAGAVLVCPAKRFVLLHRRSKGSATYPDALHILGGAYKPPKDLGVIDAPGDRDSLEFTMIREVFEESGLVVRRYQEPICVATELDTGFVQFVYLGVRITDAQAGELNANSEGDLVMLSFDDLVARLADSSVWVPTGRAQVLMWLGLGAPGAGMSPRFGGKSAKEAFSAVVAH